MSGSRWQQCWFPLRAVRKGSIPGLPPSCFGLHVAQRFARMPLKVSLTMRSLLSPHHYLMWLLAMEGEWLILNTIELWT